jgi:hypothetical protein
MWIWSTFPQRAARTAIETVVERSHGALMLTTSSRCKSLLFLVVTVLVSPWGSAAASLLSESSRSARAVEPAPLDLFSRILTFLRSAQGKAGCGIDPWGRCVPENKPSQRKAGCNIDPWGRCQP